MIDLTVDQIRYLFAKGDAERDKNFTTPDDVTRCDNVSYGPFGEDNLMDIYYKKGTAQCQPTIVSIHGGGWVYGSKKQYQYYCMYLAQQGFTVVNFNYRLAPEHPYPSGLTDINTLFTWITQHNNEYLIDLDNLFIVGDSAGGQLTSQYSAIVTNKEFQKLFDFQVPDIKIKAVGLNCGVYDMKANIETADNNLMEAYLGENKDKYLESLDTIKYMSKDFPPAIVTTSYCDFLKDLGQPMQAYLKELGVESQFKIYGAEDKQEVAHVFHVNIALDEAKECNLDTCNFFRKYIS